MRRRVKVEPMYRDRHLGFLASSSTDMSPDKLFMACSKVKNASPCAGANKATTAFNQQTEPPIQHSSDGISYSLGSKYPQ